MSAKAPAKSTTPTHHNVGAVGTKLHAYCGPLLFAAARARAQVGDGYYCGMGFFFVPSFHVADMLAHAGKLEHFKADDVAFTVFVKRIGARITDRKDFNAGGGVDKCFSYGQDSDTARTRCLWCTCTCTGLMDANPLARRLIACAPCTRARAQRALVACGESCTCAGLMDVSHLAGV